MNRINWGKVLIGGLIAGLVINAGEFVLHGLVLGNDWMDAMKALGRANPSATQMQASYFLFFGQGFLVGIAGVWLYAAIRPRYGAGPGTAVKAAIGAWVLRCVGPSMVQYAFSLYPAKLITVPMVAEIVIMILALVIGAAPYGERGSATGT